MKRQRVKVQEFPDIEEEGKRSPEEVESLLLEHDEPDKPDPPPIEEESVEYIEPPLTQSELIDLRWILWGKCPNCHADIKDWNPGPFNPKHYRTMQDDGIDALTGHKQTCDTKWMRMSSPP